MTLEECDAALREFALGYPEAWEDFPWDERVIKVRKKIFVFIGFVPDGRWRMTAKLPDSGQGALTYPFSEAPGYGLGKAGWVTALFAPGEEAPADVLSEWIDESYRAVAPKMLVKQLPPPGVLPPQVSGGGGRCSLSRWPSSLNWD